MPKASRRHVLARNERRTARDPPAGGGGPRSPATASAAATSGQKDFDRFVQVSAGRLRRCRCRSTTRRRITLSALRTRCRRLKRTKGLALVVIDYLQLMRPAAGTRPESRVLEISKITQGLKALAKELAVPVIALSQLVARGGEPRGQAAAALGSARVRLDRAGRRRGDVHLPRRILPAAARAQADGLRLRGQVPDRAGEMAAATWSRCTTGPSSTSPSSAMGRPARSTSSSRASSPASPIWISITTMITTMIAGAEVRF